MTDANVTLLREGSKITGFRFKEKEFRCDNAGIVEVYLKELKGFNIGTLPDDVALAPLFKKDGYYFPGVIWGTGGKEEFAAVASMYFEEERMYWYYDFSMEKYFGAMKEALKIREKQEGDVVFENVESSDFGCKFDYMVFLYENLPADEAVMHFVNIAKEIEGDTERILQREFISQDSLRDEKRFTLEVLLPLLRRMEFIDIHYNHGQREFGKDITFSEIDKFGQRRNWGMQVKVGDLSGNARSILGGIITQINEAFPHEYIDTSSREKRLISDLIVAISGHFKDKAKEKIQKEIRAHNVHFFDVEKIEELLVKHFGQGIKQTKEAAR